MIAIFRFRKQDKQDKKTKPVTVTMECSAEYPRISNSEKTPGETILTMDALFSKLQL